MKDQYMRKINLCLLGITGAIALAVCIANAETFNEDFAYDPFTRGWQVYGEPTLFAWNPTNQNLQVTWDSTRPNSYFYRKLETILTLADAFELQFNLQLENVVVDGWGFQIALGFINLEDATSTNFLRGTGANSPNLFEFDYFPDVGFGPSIAVTMTDASSRFAFWYATVPLECGVNYRVQLIHPPGATNVEAFVWVDDQLYTSLAYCWVSTNFTDFRLNTIAISSYSDAGSGGTIRANGIVDNITISTPPQPMQNIVYEFEEGACVVQFLSQTNWAYTLQRTQDFATWTDVSTNVIGTGAILQLKDTNPPIDRAFYRVRAYRP